MEEKPRKSLGLRLKKRRRDSDPTEEERTHNRPRKEEPKPSRVRSNSLGDRKTHKPTTKTEAFSSQQDISNTVVDSGIGSSRGFLFPGHNYLGPGNPENNGPPTNRVDQAAQHHDTAYGEAVKQFETSGDEQEAFQSIQEADDTFLSELSETTPGNYTEFFGKLAGQIGITAKKNIEGVLHSTLYPRFKREEVMDVTDGSEENSHVYSLPQGHPGTSLISLGSGVKSPHQTKWHFNKHFEIALESHLIQFSKTEASTEATKGETKIKTFIHSLPWEKLYFYLTEKEYNTIVNSFHTAYVESVTIRIYNLGVNSQSIQSSGVSIKSFSQNHYLGIWRGFEKHGPVELGSSLTSKFLYGCPLSDLPNKTSFTNVETKYIGAVSELKPVDNRITYKSLTSTYDKTQNKSVKLGDSGIYLPPAYEMANLKVNAVTSIGLIYETTYKPVDGLFHNKSYAFHNNSVIQHRPYDVNIDLADNGSISDATYVISGSSDSDQISYEDATIDNMFFRSIQSNNALRFVDGLGIGLFPKRTKDDKNVDANLEIGIDTEIVIRAEAFGGSVLSSGSSNYPQSNPNRIYFLHKNKKFGNSYTSNGLPTLANKS